MSGRNLWRAVARALVVLQFASVGAPAFANPRGGTVVSGTASITDAGAVTTINQATDRAIINWQGFSNAAGETVRFNQPSATAATLNRVTGNEASVINGAMSANGRVFLINPNGVVFGKTATVNTAGLVASTLDIADDDFRNGDYKLRQDPAKPLGAVVNQGSISTAPGGAVVLVAPVVNNEGTITAPGGKVALLAGTKATVTMDPQGLVSVGVNESVAGNVLVPRAAVSGMLEQVVNNRDLVDAGSVVTSANGEVTLGGAAGVAMNQGKIDVSGATAGRVRVEGARLAALAPGSTIHANGVGAHSNGGDVRVISPRTAAFAPSARIEAKGGATGDGGFVEVSGHQKVYAHGSVNTTAANGQRGTYLIDPATITIVDGANGSGALDDNFCSGAIGFATCSGANTVTVNRIQEVSQTSDVLLQATCAILFENTQIIFIGAGTGGGANVTFEVGPGGTITRGAVGDPGCIFASQNGTITFQGGAGSTIDLTNICVINGCGNITVNAGLDFITSTLAACLGTVNVTVGRDILCGNSAGQLDFGAQTLNITAGGRIGTACNPIVTQTRNLNLTLTGTASANIGNFNSTLACSLVISTPSTANEISIQNQSSGCRFTVTGGVMTGTFDIGSFGGPRTNLCYTAAAGCLTIHTLASDGRTTGGNFIVSTPGAMIVNAVSTLGDVTLNAGSMTLQGGASGLLVGNNVTLNSTGNILDGNGPCVAGSTNVVGRTSVLVNSTGLVEGNYHTPTLNICAGTSTATLDACVKLGKVTAACAFRVVSNTNILDNNTCGVDVTARIARFEAGGTIGVAGADQVIEIAADFLSSSSVGTVAFRDASRLTLDGINTGGAGIAALQVCASTLDQGRAIVAPALQVRGNANALFNCFASNQVSTIAIEAAQQISFFQQGNFTVGSLTTPLGTVNGVVANGGTNCLAGFQRILLASLDGMTLDEGITAPCMLVSLSFQGNVNQVGANSRIIADRLSFTDQLSGAGVYTLNNANNNVRVLGSSQGVAGQTCVFRDVDGVIIAPIISPFNNTAGFATPGALTLQAPTIRFDSGVTANQGIRLIATGAVTQAATAPLLTTALTLQSTGTYTLCATGNSIPALTSAATVGSVSVRTVGNLATFGTGVATNNGAITLSANNVNIGATSPINSGTAKTSVTARTGTINGAAAALDVVAGSLDLIASTGQILCMDATLTAAGDVFAQVGGGGGGNRLNLCGAPTNLKMQVANTANSFRIDIGCTSLVLCGTQLSTTGTLTSAAAFQAAAGNLTLGTFAGTDLTLTAAQTVAQAGSLTVNQLLVRNASTTGTVTLDNACNAIGTLAASVAADFTVNTLGALTVGSVTPVLDLVPVAVNGITTTNDVVTLTSGAGIGGTGLITAGSVTLTAQDAITANLAAATVSATGLQPTSAIDLQNAGPGCAVSITNLTATGAVSYRQTGAASATFGAVSSNTCVTLETAGDMILNGAVTSGVTTLKSEGRLQGTGTVTAQSVTLCASGCATLSLAATAVNATSRAGALALTNAPTMDAFVTLDASGGARYVQSGAFQATAGSVTAGGDLAFENAGALRFNGALTVGGNAGVRGSAIDLLASFTAGGDATLTATTGAVVGSGRLTAVNGTLSAVTSIGGVVDLFQTALGSLTATAAQGVFVNEQDALALNTVTATTIRVNAGGALTDSNGAALNLTATDATLNAASIGSAADPLELDLGLASLTASALTGGLFVVDPNDLGVAAVVAAQAISIQAGGVLTVGAVTAGTTLALISGGTLTVGALRGTTATLTAGGDLVDANGAAANLTATSARLTAGGVIGNASDAFDVVLAGPLFVDANGSRDNVSVSLAGTLNDGSVPQIIDGVLDARGFFNDVQFFPVNTALPSTPAIVNATIALATVGRPAQASDAPIPGNATQPARSLADTSRVQNETEVDVVNPFMAEEESEDAKKRKRAVR